MGRRLLPSSPSGRGCFLLRQPNFQNILEGPRFKNLKIAICTPIMINSPPFFVIYGKVTEAYRTWVYYFISSLSPILSEICLPKVFGNFTEALRKSQKPFYNKTWGCLARKKEKVLNALDGPRFENYYLHPFLLNTLPLCVLFFFLSISFWNIAKLYGLCNDTYFPSETSRNSTDYATVLVLRVPKGAKKVRKLTVSTPRRN